MRDFTLRLRHRFQIGTIRMLQGGNRTEEKRRNYG